jgi:hypothetical protein
VVATVSSVVAPALTLAGFAAPVPPGGVGVPPPHGLAGDALLRGAAAAVAKSALLLSVSVQPFAARKSASVVLGAGAVPEPSKKFAAPWPTRSTICASCVALHRRCRAVAGQPGRDIRDDDLAAAGGHVDRPRRVWGRQRGAGCSAGELDEIVAARGNRPAQCRHVGAEVARCRSHSRTARTSRRR